MYECEHCGKSFTRQHNLYKHQRVAKYCLRMREEKQLTTCKFCNQKFKSDHAISHYENECTHTKNGSAKESNQSNLMEMIISLQNRIIDLTERNAKDTNNKATIDLQPITDKDLKQYIDNLTLDFILDGGKGYASFAGCYPFKDRLICTDKSRRKLRYKNSDGEIVDDGGGIKLTQRFFKAISERNEEIINTEYRLLHAEVEKIAQGSSDSDRDLSDLLAQSTKLQQLLISCQQAARGEENDLTKEFIKHLIRDVPSLR